jgi:hypothetical protein
MRSVNLGNGKVAMIKSSISAASILKLNPCADEFERYVKCFGFRNELTDAEVRKVITDSVFGGYLLSRGLISIEDDEKRFYVGSQYRVNIKSAPGTKVLTLCKVSDPVRGKGYCIWSLINTNSGERWDGSYPTKEKDYLTEKELSAVTGVKQPAENFIKGKIRERGI